MEIWTSCVQVPKVTVGLKIICRTGMITEIEDTSIFFSGSVDKTSDRRDRGRVSSCPRDTMTLEEE